MMNAIHKRASAPKHDQPKMAFGTSVGKFAAGLALAGMALGASAFDAPADGVYKDRIDWGVMLDASGPVSTSQVPFLNGIQAYLRKVNDAGGIHGRKINVLPEDDRYDAAQDRINYEKFVSQTPVLGISGLGNSSAQAALMPAIKRGKVPIVGSYTNTKVGLEPANPMFYSGSCGYREQALVGVGYFTSKLKLKAPKVAVVHLDVASGVEYYGHIEAAVAKFGGTAKSVPIKVTAIDANAQVRDIIAMKPDFVAVHGGATSAILTVRTMQQYGLKMPTFGIIYQGTPAVYTALGAEAGSNYYFVSCVTPASVNEPGGGVKEMGAAADKYGFSALKDDVNFVQGWMVGQIVAEAITKTGPEPTREKLVAFMDKGFEVDTKGASSPVKYTKDDHRGPVVLRPYSYDFKAKKFKAEGKYSDYQKLVN